MSYLPSTKIGYFKTAYAMFVLVEANVSGCEKRQSNQQSNTQDMLIV